MERPRCRWNTNWPIEMDLKKCNRVCNAFRWLRNYSMVGCCVPTLGFRWFCTCVYTYMYFVDQFVPLITALPDDGGKQTSVRRSIVTVFGHECTMCITSELWWENTSIGRDNPTGYTWYAKALHPLRLEINFNCQTKQSISHTNANVAMWIITFILEVNQIWNMSDAFNFPHTPNHVICSSSVFASSPPLFHLWLLSVSYTHWVPAALRLLLYNVRWEWTHGPSIGQAALAGLVTVPSLFSAPFYL